MSASHHRLREITEITAAAKAPATTAARTWPTLSLGSQASLTFSARLLKLEQFNAEIARSAFTIICHLHKREATATGRSLGFGHDANAFY